MSDDLTTSSRSKCPKTQTRAYQNRAKRAFPGIFSDIDPTTSFPRPMPRHRVRPRRQTLVPDRPHARHRPKTLWRWKTHNENFQQALAAARSTAAASPSSAARLSPPAPRRPREALTDPAIPKPPARRPDPAGKPPPIQTPGIPPRCPNRRRLLAEPQLPPKVG